MEGGYHRANVELKAYLRDGWVLPALPVLVEESAAALGEGASEAARREQRAQGISEVHDGAGCRVLRHGQGW